MNYGYAGSWDVNDRMTFTVQTVDNQGRLTDADSGPDYRIYRDEIAVPVLTGTMALLDAVNTTGLYSEEIDLTNANGFFRGQSYTIYIEYLNGPRLFGELRQLQIGAAADMEFIQTSDIAATQLRLSADQIIAGIVDDATLAPSQTVFESSFLAIETDLYTNRDLYWSSGTLRGSKTSITGYSFTNGKGRFTVAAMIVAPVDGDLFFLI